MGNRHPSIAPYETLRCKDDLLAVCCGNDGQFRGFVEVLDAAELADDPRFATNPARVGNRDALVEALEARLSHDTVDAWVTRLSVVGVPVGKVGDIADAVALATSLDLEPLIPLGPDAPPQVRHPVRYSDTPVTRYAAPPRLGQHNDDVRRWLAEENTP
jgi:formyl-CoA transferase